VNERDRAEGRVVGARALALALFDTATDHGPWRGNRACRDTDPTVFDGETRATRDQARRICSACPVQRQCATDQITWEAAYPGATRYLHGVVGALTPADRFQIHHPDYRDRRQPVVVSTLDSEAA
jgi:hypothetical protein